MIDDWLFKCWQDNLVRSWILHERCLDEVAIHSDMPRNNNSTCVCYYYPFKFLSPFWYFSFSFSSLSLKQICTFFSCSLQEKHLIHVLELRCHLEILSLLLYGILFLKKKKLLICISILNMHIVKRIKVTGFLNA